jgi:protein-L-isoaspartate(D-aspartate) O-methyltransferase
VRATKSERLRRELVRQLEEAGQIHSPAVRDAFLAVPREVFVPEFARDEPLDTVYEARRAIVTRKDENGWAVSSASAPSIVGIMLEHLDLERGLNVLEIGAGTGYNAALLKHIVGARGRLTSVDIDDRNVRDARERLRALGYPARFATGDGRLGFPAHAPYDRITATVASPDVPRTWFRQVKVGGSIQLPLQLNVATSMPQAVVTFVKTREGLESIRVSAGGFMGMRDEASSRAAQVRYIELLERGGGAPDKTIAMLSGGSIAELDTPAKFRLLALALEPTRRQRVNPGGNVFGLHAYIATAVPSGRLIVAGWGLVDAKARSFAYLRPQKTGLLLRASGTPWAEQKLLGLIESWKQLGRPAVDRLRIRVTYGKQPPRAWRTSVRDGCALSFDWAKSST